MGADLSPKLARMLTGVDGGSYQVWSSSDLPVLGDAKLGAGKLVLKPLGFALPHYADSSKVGYVIQGNGIAGLLLPTASPKEKVVPLHKGDFIAVPLGAASWWYNDGDTDLSILFIGDTSTAVIPGEFTYYFLAGTIGILKSFSKEFTTKAWGVTEDEAQKLFGSQPGTLIVTLDEKISGLEPCDAYAEGITLKVDNPSMVVTRDNLPLIGEAGFYAKLIELEANGVLLPRFDTGVRLVGVVRGSGRVQIVSANGLRVLDAAVEEGSLFAVPKFFVMSMIAGGEGMELCSITTTSGPVMGYLAGKESILKALSPRVLEVSLNVTPDLAKLLLVDGSTNGDSLPKSNKGYFNGDL